MTVRTLLFTLTALAFTACNSTNSRDADASRAAPSAGAFDDDPHPLTDVESAIIQAGRDPDKLAALEQQFVLTLLQPFDDPKVIEETARNLGIVLQLGPNGPRSATLASLAVLLEDPARVDYARLVLDRVPGAAVDQIYLNALPAAHGRVRVALINSLGARAVPKAVPLLAASVDDPDPAVARASATALGRIGGPAALQALEESQRTVDADVLNARLAAAAESGPDVLRRTAADVYGQASAPLASRATALRMLLDADPTHAVERVHQALTGVTPTFRRVALEAVGTLRAPGAAAELAGRRASYAIEDQAALFAALGTLGDDAAVPALIEAAANADSPAELRLAAVDALGRLPGTTAMAEELAQLATEPGALGKAAAASLARLSGTGIDDFIRYGAVRPGTAARTVYVQQVAARNLTLAIPSLLALRQDPEEAVRLEALDALRQIAAGYDEPAILAWALAAPGGAEQSRAVRALVTIILRDDDTTLRTQRVIEAIRKGELASRRLLFPILSRVPNAAGLAAARDYALSPDATEAEIATTELARWPDPAVLPVLAEVANETRFINIRVAAARAAAAFLARQGGVPSAESARLVRGLLELPLPNPERLSLLNVLSFCADKASLATAQKLVSDPALATSAKDAIEALESTLAGPPVFTASGNAAVLPNLTDGNSDTHWTIPNTPDQWLRADMHRSRPIRRIVADPGQRGWEFPAQLDVLVSDNPDNPGEVLGSVDGQRGTTTVVLPAGVHGRYVWIRQVGKRSGVWAVAELLIQ